MSIFETRELTVSDISLVADYWINAAPDFLLSIGADPDKIPKRGEFEVMLLHQLQQPISERQSYALIWTEDGVPIGHCNLNPFIFGETGYLHVHLWNQGQRRKGIGVILLRKSVFHFFEVLGLKTIYSEPYSKNVAPNKALEKAGFLFEKTHTTVPGSINFEQEVNRWKIVCA